MVVEVVNIKNYHGNVIYVGRKCYGFKGHALANPFRLPPNATLEERRQCLAKYREWLPTIVDLDEHISILAEQVRATGQPLGCWCVPLECHASILAKMVEEKLQGGKDACLLS